MIIIIGGWTILLSEIAGYTYQEQQIGYQPFVQIILKSGHVLKGQVPLSTIDAILSYWKGKGS